MLISIIIPTLNEVQRIAAAIQAVVALPGDKELIVVDGGSTDGTVAAARAVAPEGTKFLQARRGRASQMNAAAAAAKGEGLLFLHADTRLPSNALTSISEALGDPTIVGGAFTMRFDERGIIYRVMAWSNNLRSRRAVTGDQAIFARSVIFRAIGGYPPLALMEDLALSKALRRLGRLCLLRPPVLVSARRHRRNGPLKVLLQGWMLQLLWLWGVGDKDLHRMYYGAPAD